MTRLLVILTAALGGCTGLELPALSAGAAVAQGGATVVSRGKAQAFEAAPFDSVVQAVRTAAAELALDPGREHLADGRATLRFSDERGETIIVVVERRTARITRFQADVGLFGWTGLASLFMRRVQEHLAAP